MSGPTRRQLCAGAALAGLSACASTPQVVPVPAGATLGLEVLAAPADGVVPISNLSVGSSTSTGSLSGATAGGLWGLSCGPLAIVCVPLGAMLGGATGAGAGAVVGLTGALSDEQATRLRERLSRLGRRHDLQAELHQELSRRAAVRWKLGDTEPDYLLTASWRGLALTSTRDAQISLIAEVAVNLQRRTANAPLQTLSRKSFRVVSPSSPLALWLDEQGDLPDTLFSSASVQLAAQIVGEFATV